MCQSKGFLRQSLSEFGADEPSDEGVANPQLHGSHPMTIECWEENHVALVLKGACGQRIVDEFELTARVGVLVRKLNHHAHLPVERCVLCPVVVLVPAVGAAVLAVVLRELDLMEPGDVKPEGVGIGFERHALDAVVERRQKRVGAGEPPHLGPAQVVIDDALASVPHSRGDRFVGQSVLDEPLALFGSERTVKALPPESHAVVVVQACKDFQISLARKN